MAGDALRFANAPAAFKSQDAADLVGKSPALE